MREIKFRGKRIDNGEWVYGDLLHYALGQLVIRQIGGKFEEFKVIPETVGQFTGKTDKNGKDIYEGDIVKITENNLPNEVKPFGEVKWLDKCSKFVFEREYEKGNCGFIIEPWTECEIVGSKIENPNLLK